MSDVWTRVLRPRRSLWRPDWRRGWDRQQHLVDRFEIPASWRRIRAVDFGYTNPFVCLWIAIDDDGRTFVLRDSLVARDPLLDDAKRPCSIVEEFDGYVWIKGDAGRALKDEPMKLNDHALDALRHATMAIDQKVPPVESAGAREQREQAEWAENERRWRDPHAEHWWTRW